MIKRALVSAVSLVALALGACKDDGVTHEVYFEGYVYDGANGSKITGFDIALLYRDKTVNGKVSEDGRFVLGPIPVWQDYSVSITKGDYRSFLSHNAGINVPAAVANGTDPAVDTMSTTQTFYFDSYLFPTWIQTGAVTFNVLKAEDSTAVSSGRLRLRPRTLSSVQTSMSGTAAGVGSQVWSNDLDLLVATVDKQITDGKVKIEAGELTYGVQYQVSIYAISGYQPYSSSSDDYVAGSQGDRIFKVSQESVTLVMLNHNAAQCTLPSASAAVPSAEILINFNTEVEVAGDTLTNASYLDSYLTVSAGSNVLNTSGVRGCSVGVTNVGSQVALRWNPSLGLQSPIVTGDNVTLVRYGGLQNIYVQPKGKPTQKVSLGQLVCGGTSSCTLLCGSGA